MAVDDLAMQGIRASAAMVLIHLSTQIIPLSGPQGLSLLVYID